jgi:hypothetical protein
MAELTGRARRIGRPDPWPAQYAFEATGGDLPALGTRSSGRADIEGMGNIEGTVLAYGGFRGAAPQYSFTPSTAFQRRPPRPPSFENAAAMLEAARGGMDPLTGGRRRRGRAATILTGSEGAGLPNTATKALLGE